MPPDRVSSWQSALEARERDLVRRTRIYVIEFTVQHGQPPTEDETEQAIVEGR